MLSKILNIIKSYQYHIFLIVSVALISFISFNLGKISSGEKGSIKVTEGANIYQAAKGQVTSGQEGSGILKTTPKPLNLRVVASKASDSKKYHYTWCASSKRIKPENQIWFTSDTEAESNGYILAGNCSR